MLIICFGSTRTYFRFRLNTRCDRNDCTTFQHHLVPFYLAFVTCFRRFSFDQSRPTPNCPPPKPTLGQKQLKGIHERVIPLYSIYSSTLHLVRGAPSRKEWVTCPVPRSITSPQNAGYAEVHHRCDSPEILDTSKDLTVSILRMMLKILALSQFLKCASPATLDMPSDSQ